MSAIAPAPPVETPIAEAAPLETSRRLLCYSSARWNSQLQVISGAAWFKNIVVTNKGVPDFWLWVCDSSGQATDPTLAPIFVPGSSTQSIDRTSSPRLMSSGIYVCATTDPVTKTLITAADAFFEVTYEMELDIPL